MNQLERLEPSRMIKNFSLDCMATLLWSVSLAMVILPNEIAPGGTTGITVIINHFLGLPLGMLSFLINLPLLIWAWRVLGRSFVIQTLMTSLTFTIGYDYVIPLLNLPPYTNDPLMGSIMAGVLNGAATGLVFMHGSSGGGTDLLTKIVKRLRPHLSVGQIVLAVNGVVMTSVAILYGSLEALLYGLVMTFTSGQVVDLMLNGASSANSITIMTSQPEAIAQQIIQELNRSATIVQGEGAYTHHGMAVMFCVVRKHEMLKLRMLISQTDPRAFLIVHEAKQVFGGNFVAPQN